MITTELVSVDDYIPRFRPAIRDTAISQRYVEWFTIKFNYNVEILFFRLLNSIGLNYRYFTFKQRQSRRYASLHGGERFITRAWLPGYVFVEICIQHDFWQQLYDFPGFVDILGNPTALLPGEIDDLEPRFLGKIPARDPGVPFAIGDTVRVKSGLFATFTGIITSVTKTTATFCVMFAGRPTPATLYFFDIERVDVDAKGT